MFCVSRPRRARQEDQTAPRFRSRGDGGPRRRPSRDRPRRPRQKRTHNERPAERGVRCVESEVAATRDLGGGRHAIGPAEPDKSELVKRVTHADEAMRMPPADSGRALTKREVDLLTEWIRQGAKWRAHWA